MTAADFGGALSRPPRLRGTTGAKGQPTGVAAYLAEVIVHGGEYRRRGRLIAELRSRGVPGRLVGFTMFGSRAIGQAELDGLGARVRVLDALDEYRVALGLGPDEVLLLPCPSGVAISETAGLGSAVVITEELASSDVSAAIALGRDALDTIARSRVAQPSLFD